MSVPPATARAALWVALFAVVTRLLYLVEHAGSAFFGVPILDEAYYDGLALTLLGVGGDPAIMNPGFRPWGYPLFLAGAHGLAEPLGRPLAVAVQHLLGIATAVMVVWLAARLTRNAVGGAIAGVLFVLAGPPLFFEGELLITSVFTFLTTLVVTLLGRAGDETDHQHAGSGLGRWLILGVVCGMAIQARANAVLLLGLLPAVAWVATSRRPNRRVHALTHLAVAGAGLLAVMVAFGWFQHRITGRFGLMPSAGGVNLYLGNKRGADGMVPRQDWDVTYDEAYRDSVEVFAVEGFTRAHPSVPPTPGRISHYWRQRATQEVMAAPRAWFGLMLRKCSYLLWDEEIPNNKRYRFVVAEESPLLGALPVRWWLLLALAPLGVSYAWRRGDRRRLVWLLGVAGLQAAGVVLFFVTARYRIPLWPLACALAAGGCLWLVDAARQRNVRSLALGLGIAIVAATIALLPRSEASWPSPGRDYFFRSIANLEQGQLDEAVADGRESVRLDPGDGASWLQLGNALEANDAPAKALDAYRRAQTLRPNEPRVANNIGVVLETLGRPHEAHAAYLQALGQTKAGYPPALVNAALLELRAGLVDAAANKLERATARGFDSISLRFAHGIVARARGDATRFEQHLAPLRANHPEVVARLLLDQSRPLDPTALRAEGRPP